MKTYHASNCIVEKPDVFHSRKYLDFGSGFYMTYIRSQAVKYGERFSFRQMPAYLNVYEFDGDLTGYKVKRFEKYDDEWLTFVANCRADKDVERFDVVMGGIANDKVFRTIDLYLAGEMSKEDALKQLVYEKPNNQICILNQEVIDKHLSFIKAEIL